MLLDDAREGLRPEFVDRRKNAKPVNLPLISPIGLISLLYALGLFVFYRQGFVSALTFIGAAGAVLSSVILFYTVFRLKLHLQFKENSLMLPQILAALCIMLTVAHVEPSTQIALVPFILIAFSFAIFRLSTASLILLAVACLGTYLAIILLRDHDEGYAIGLRADMMQWFVLALTLPGMIVVGKQIQNLRQILNTTRYRLKHFEEKSIRDELTGLYNRRQLQAELAHAILQANTMAKSFSVCVIDIDHFKQINDSDGHLAGDAVLQRFASIARETIRDSDIFGRYGGDEFLQILPDTDLKGAVMHAERLRVYAHFMDVQKLACRKNISLSIGVAQYYPGEEITDLIARADSALYRAKQLGRNRVEWIERP
ncbi:MAG TPA: GGDEF domain-containing protein [Noviherbaspirillum sp.]|jgi:diguanylate cyclase (GGDEF)-like protein|uniref:GGDEF domain-containing protein n=1 Tax=Noviherbaspirillum sp. TaxID=1926288 RepID=UPI002DDCB3F4|nr:GGDEF domain-containing protein [Noviherbaspirillum sp.]HEV2609893.1 GGDEF domain-containing protein [Noviherbaspirillum sp.]